MASMSVHRCSVSFQSTHPVRGATVERERLEGILNISIHAPREGCDERAEVERVV